MLSKTNFNLENNYFKYLSDSELVSSIFRKGFRKNDTQERFIEKVYMTRLYYREKALIIQYHVYFNQSDNFEIYYGKLFHTKEKFEKYKNKLDENNYFSIDEYNLIILFFPYDPKLKSLTQICASDTNNFSIAHLLDSDDNDSFKIKNFKVFGYRLERRAVLELETKEKIKVDDIMQNNFVLKLVKPAKSKALFEKSILLEKYGLGSSVNDSLSIPKIYGFDESQGFLLMEKVEGTTLHNLIGQESFAAECGKTAEILKKIHSIPTDGLKEFSVMHELRILTKQIEIIELMYPGDSKQFIEAYEILEDSINMIKPVPMFQCIHRDFYDKQIICSKTRTTIVDFDNLTAGDPALDYGNFIAHLYLRMCQTPDNAQQIVAGEQEFKNKYDANEQFLKRALWWQSATMLRLAAIYYFRPRWRELTIHLLRKSISTLER